ncbi:MAG: serpin family protein [Gemmatimonadaceae bacterium]
MRHVRVISLLTLAALAACRTAAVTDSATQPDSIRSLSRELTTGERALVTASDTFGVALLKALNASRADSNMFLSPLSVSMALGMVMNGAAGTTYDEMRRGLGFGVLPQEEINKSYESLTDLLLGLDKHVTFKIANSVWTDQKFATSVEPAFLGTVKQYFDAEAAVIDFRSPNAVPTINTWAEQNTAGRIKRVLDRIADNEVMFLMNAIYFKGDWRIAFDPKQTAPRPFTLLSGQRIQVPTMYRKGNVRRGQILGATVVELPYGGSAFTMTVLLPDSGTTVNTLIGRLTPNTWRQAQTAAQLADVGLYLPKLKLSWKAGLLPELYTLGMNDMQNPSVADFSKLARGARPGDLYITKVQHDSYVDVNEVGTEAAAVTTVGVGVTSVCLTCDVRIDRPYLFAITERLSGTVLFVGKIVRPELN